MDLSDWTAKWLKTAGPNRVRLVSQCDKGKLSKLTVKQRPSVSGTLSPHRALLGFYQDHDGKLSLKGEVGVLYSSESTEVKVEGRDCPDFILPNLNDFDYALYALDESSLQKAKVALSHLPDPLSRLMVWGMLYQVTRDAELNPVIFIENALEALKTEADDLLLGSLLGRFSHIKNVYELYLGKEQREKIAPRFEALLWNRVEQAKPGVSLQMSFYDFFVTVAQTEASVSRLFEILTKNNPPKGITLDQDRRWAILMNLSTNGHPEATKLMAEELKRDPSTLGKRMALAAKAAYPSKTSKEQMWNDVLTNKELTHSDLEEVGARMHGVNYPELSEAFLKPYFKWLTTLKWQDHDDKIDVYFEALFPHRLCTEKLRSMSQKYLGSAKNLTSTARRSWMEAQDELTRCVKVRQLLSSKSDGHKSLN
jgi:aminopeptidase N